ncbi:MAG: UDP-N-acetylmuramoyl-L-alanine--D-glutamate ligase [Actinomycetales bacterium]
MPPPGDDGSVDWAGVQCTVAGLGVAGFAVAEALLERGASVCVVDSSDGDSQRERAEVLGILGARVVLGAQDEYPGGDLLVVSPGLRPNAPIITDALHRGITVWGELELAWRLRGQSAPPWLLVTGTNGKTTATLMLASMLTAAGLRTTAAGNIGVSLVEVVTRESLDVIAVEVGAPQLPFVTSMSPWAAACLNIAEDHVDHFGSMAAYRAAKARVYHLAQLAAVYNVDDPQTEQMVEDADVIAGCRAIGFTLGVPKPGMLGVVDDILVDRAFVADRRTSAQELATVGDVRPHAPHNVANALAAAALARSYGVEPAAVREGLRAFKPAPHRISTVATIGGVAYVDDSKATNAHAALTSLQAYTQVVWIAGGLAKGQRFEDLIKAVRDRLRGVVLLGRDREVIAEALRELAPQVPVIEVSSNEPGAMYDVVRQAAALASPGTTVLLAPGCASWDMYRDYGHRGDTFVQAVRSLPT